MENPPDPEKKPGNQRWTSLTRTATNEPLGHTENWLTT